VAVLDVPAELRGDDDATAERLERLADQFLVQRRDVGNCSESKTLPDNPSTGPCMAPASRIFAAVSDALGASLHTESGAVIADAVHRQVPLVIVPTACVAEPPLCRPPRGGDP
jgi:hypothetical protein